MNTGLRCNQFISSFKTTRHETFQDDSRSMAKLLVKDEIDNGIHCAVRKGQKPGNERVVWLLTKIRYTGKKG